MTARPEQLPPTAAAALMSDCEEKAMRRLAQLTESENERIALRASEVLVKCAREWRRAEASAALRQPPAPEKPQEAKPQEGTASPRPAPATGKAVPHALVHPPRPKPAFRAVPLGFESPGHSG